MSDPRSGYKPCACRDCFEIAIGDAGEAALCHLCQDAGCSSEGEQECSVQGSFPEDYEPCGQCGIDHAYEPNEARQAHEKLEADEPGSGWETEEHQICQHYLCTIFNGDSSGLEEEDSEKIDRWLERFDLSKGHFSHDSEQEPSFGPICEVSGLRGDVITIVWNIAPVRS
jgi:hypothetical protein